MSSAVLLLQNLNGRIRVTSGVLAVLCLNYTQAALCLRCVVIFQCLSDRQCKVMY